MKMYIHVHVILIVTLAICVFTCKKLFFSFFTYVFTLLVHLKYAPTIFILLTFTFVWMNIGQLNAFTMIIQYGIGDGV